MPHPIRLAGLLLLGLLTVRAAAAPEPPAAPKPLYTLSGHTAEIYTVAFAPDGKRVGSASNQVFVRVKGITASKKTVTAKIAVHQRMAGGEIKEKAYTFK